MPVSLRDRPFALVLTGLLLLFPLQLQTGLVSYPRAASYAQAAAASAMGSAGPLVRLEPNRSSGAKFGWPAIGPISSEFGPSHPLGIDIGLALFPNSPIVASGDGLVTFAGGDACCGYGFYVIIDHRNGFSTLYAHLSTISIQEGQEVRRGQLLGMSGNTGYSTSEHLHFEIRHNDLFLDPLQYLRRDEPLG